MRLRTAAALSAVTLLTLTACFGGSATTDTLDYQVDQPLTTLVIGARAASVAIVVGEGPVTVTEEHRYSSGKPHTTHEVKDQTLRLTESGCDDDVARCDVHYNIRMPEAMSVDITAQAGAVKLDGLAGNLRVTTEAGAVEGRGLTSDEVIIEAEAGAATLEFVEAPTLSQITTTLGGVNLRLPGTTAYAVDIRTDVGASSVEVDRDPASKHKITVHTEVGGVKIERLT
jgi:DUF4097 and DUF4098 domain-containing protein YvlB